jgi:hypothetical protein
VSILPYHHQQCLESPANNGRSHVDLEPTGIRNGTEYR